MNDEKFEHSVTTVCYLCSEKFNQEDKNFRKVRDRCHYTEKYGAVAHFSCNLQHNEHSYIPGLAHNSSEYDNHLILPKTPEKFKECEFLCVGENTKRLTSFPLRKRFEKI